MGTDGPCDCAGLHAGIHAKTLLGRKVQGGKVAPLFAAMRASADEADALSRASHARCSPVAEPRDDELSFYLGKLHTCAFFFRHELPKTAPLAQLLRAGDRTVREMRVAWF
jgi:hypothetical protein